MFSRGSGSPLANGVFPFRRTRLVLVAFINDAAQLSL
jgi:hypothetical protein